MRASSSVLVLLVVAGCPRTFVEDQSASRCITYEDGAVDCAYHSRFVATGLGEINPREVHYQVPVGEAPDDGWPVVLVFQGSGASGSLFFAGWPGMPFGGQHQAEMVRDLLDNGFAVLAPEAHFNGSTYWDSNVLGYSSVWALSEDRQFVHDILDDVAGGAFGALDADTLFAAGISSGGYMTSRMAVYEPGRFSAVAIASASYAWCYSVVCWVPEVHESHPPTLFLHGGGDLLVPPSSMEPYAEALEDAGVDVRVVVDDDSRHGWIAASGPEVVAWFSAAVDAKAEPQRARLSMNNDE